MILSFTWKGKTIIILYSKYLPQASNYFSIISLHFKLQNNIGLNVLAGKGTFLQRLWSDCDLQKYIVEEENGLLQVIL